MMPEAKGRIMSKARPALLPVAAAAVAVVATLGESSCAERRPAPRVAAAESKAVERKVPWDMDALSKKPEVHPTDARPAKGVHSFFYEGADYKGKPTWVFAYFAAPKGNLPKGGWPAVVCAHGGGGTAYPAWVRKWNKEGYAAIAMDLEGHLPGGKHHGMQGNFPTGKSHKNAGPSRVDWFGDINLPDEEQWFYHAVADVIRANSLLRSFPEINAEKIGLTGISWGGTIVSAVAGLDQRFVFVVPVYGCGFIHESDNPGLAQWFPPKHMTAEQFRDYCTKWDPSAHLPHATMPMLWMSGFDDPVFQFNIFERSARAAGGPSIMCVRGHMVHGHGFGWQKHDLYAFADSIVKGGDPYPTLGRPKVDPKTRLVRAAKTGNLRGASLFYTKSTGKWKGRWWDNIRCDVHEDYVISQSPLPEETTAFNVNAKDERGLLVSSELGVLPRHDRASP